jgi:DNA excision repair protein ERCC-2
VPASSKPVVSASVRSVVEFALRRGDLGAERDFVGSGRALAGVRGQQRLQRSRPAGYEREVRVVGEVDAGDFLLRVSGRIDGLMAGPQGVWVEEIKTVRSGWERTADSLHWAQAKFYGWMYAQEHALDKVTVQLTYLDLDSGQVTEFKEDFPAAELRRFFEETTAIYLAWVRDHRRWCELRNQSLRALTFPFSSYRPGQRQLAVAAYRLFSRGGRLFLEAPTGIGKTISVLLPAMKALGEGSLERVFYLTARTVGRGVAENAFADLRRAGARLRTVTLTARDKVCKREGRPCDAATCPLARGYYDRYQSAMRDALEREEITRPVLESVSQTHQVCPFELSLDLSLWADAVVCDYNYVFDPRVFLRRHFAEEPMDGAFLVDEAHNLVDRGREMFSAVISGRDIQTVKREIRQTLPRCARALGKVLTFLRKLRPGLAPAAEPAGDASPREPDLFESPAVSMPEPGEEIAAQAEGLELRGVQVWRELPEGLVEVLDAALAETEAWLARNEPAGFREALLELYFQLRSLRRAADWYDERFVTLLEPGPALVLRLFCLDPSHLLRQALARGKAAVFFSATLTPLEYYRELLGGEPADPVIRLPSPFPPEHLAVLVQNRIRTQLKSRADTVGEVVESIAAVARGRRGNYLVYFPSYQYLADVLARFQAAHPDLRVLAQRPGMTETERDEFLARFAVEQPDTLVGFAVLGGIFGEGIDLVGDRLIGAVIVGVGLPQLCAERDLIRDYFEGRCGRGFDYAYTFPGMNRVLQAMGRVIRSERDRGVVLLVDTRFGEGRYRRLFPGWWRPVRVANARQISEAVRAFWESAGPE